MSEAGVSDAICRHVASASFSALPSAAAAAARKVLLDATGVIYAASGLSPDVEPFLALARSAGQGPCDVLGTGLRVSAQIAALANGAMAHALDYEDAFDAAPSHPNASLAPAALALAQTRKVDGKTFLTALAVGCDIACRIGLSLKKPMEEGGWYPPPIIGAFGAAAGCARLMDLDWKQTRDALSLMLCQATMPGEIMHSRETTMRAVREAFPAQAAVLASQLAGNGVPGFEQPLEGQAGFFRLYADGDFDAQILVDGLGSTYFGEHLSFKPWPACRGTHAFIELAQLLPAQHGFAWRDVRQIMIHADPIHKMLLEPAERKQAPSVPIDAKFSIPFTVALSLVRGRVALEDFSIDALSDPDVLSISRLVTCSSQVVRSRTMGSGGAMTIRLSSGQEFTAELGEALGGPGRPMTDEALVEKFIDCAGRAERPIRRADAEQLCASILDLENCADVGALFQQS